jgi:hypothetical protein
MDKDSSVGLIWIRIDLLDLYGGGFIGLLRFRSGWIEG